jgi:hypothetical protein
LRLVVRCLEVNGLPGHDGQVLAVVALELDRERAARGVRDVWDAAGPER